MTPPASERRSLLSPRMVAIAMFVAALAVALAPRIAFLGAKGLWMDEAYGVSLVRLPLAQLVDELRLESTPPLHCLILSAWVAVFGSSEFAVRLLSAFFSVAGIATIGAFACRYFSRASATIAVLLLSVAPLHVYYAQEARMYALLALLGSGLVFCAFDYCERERRAALIGAGALSIALLYTHTVALWLVAGVNVAIFIACRTRRRVLLRWLGVQAIAGLCFVPWFIILLQQISAQQIVLEWFVYIWESKSISEHLLDSVGAFTLGGYPPYVAMKGQLAGEFWIRIAAVALVVWGLVRRRDSACLRFTATVFGVALVLSLLYSSIAQPVHIPGRTDHALLPLFILMLAIGIDAVRPRAVGVLVAAGWIAASLVVLIPYYEDPEKNFSRDYLSDIAPESGDVVITTGKTYAETEYYFERWNLPVTLLSFPLNARKHPGYLNYEELLANPNQLVADTEHLADICRKVVRIGNRCFVILVPPLEVNRMVAARLEGEFGTGKQVNRESRRQSLLRHRVQILAYGAP